MSKQPTVLLPSGQTCRPRRLRSIYSGVREFRAYSETYNSAFRISRDPYESPDALWERNPYVVSSVVPFDLSEYNEELHPTVKRRKGQTWVAAARELSCKLEEQEHSERIEHDLAQLG